MILLCIATCASFLLFGYCLGYAGRGSDWDAMRSFRIDVYEKHFILEGTVQRLTEQNADFEQRLQYEHELRREIERELSSLKEQCTNSNL